MDSREKLGPPQLEILSTMDIQSKSFGMLVLFSHRLHSV